MIIERLAKLKEIEDSAKEKKENLKTRLSLTVQLLADAYDRWLIIITVKFMIR